MPRALWSGAISFGLVNVPVRMYPAIAEKGLHFHLVHEKDASRIRYAKLCAKEEKPVPDDEIVRAYEYRDGAYVYLTDEDFAAAEISGYKLIEIRDFVPYEQIDPITFERTYYLGPAEGPTRSTDCCTARWRTPGSPPSRRTCSTTESGSDVCGSGTICSCSSGCTSPTSSAPVTDRAQGRRPRREGGARARRRPDRSADGRLRPLQVPRPSPRRLKRIIAKKRGARRRTRRRRRSPRRPPT